MSPATIPALTLNNGVDMPALGFGVFQTPPDETRDAVAAALDAGYRHIDTAAAYGNERQVGEAVAASGLDRDEVFLETKVWISDYGYDETLHAFDKSARKLGVEQLDLLILHQALPSDFDRTLEAYRALETLLADGKVRAIGVSNFMVDHLTRLLDRAQVVPAVNQIESHPYFAQADVQAFGEQHGILAQAWSPIGGITFYRDSEHTSTLQDPTITAIAEAHGKSPAQVMLRWGLQHGRSVIPKSTKPHRIAENLDVFDFELTPDELAAIDGLETGKRGGPEPDADHARSVRPRHPGGLNHGVPPARAHRRPGLRALPRHDDVRRLGQHRPRRLDPHHPRRAGRRDQLRRHRRRLLRRRVRGDRRQGAQGPARRRRPRHQVLHADGRRPQPPRRLAPLDRARGRGLAAPPGHRLDRPLPGPPSRPRGRRRGDARRAHRSRPAGQGPLHRLLVVLRREIVEAQWVARDRRLERFRTEQPPYSLLTRLIELDVLPDRAAARHGHPHLQPARRRLALGAVDGRQLADLTRPPAPAARFDMSLPENQRKLEAVEQLAGVADDAGCR